MMRNRILEDNQWRGSYGQHGFVSLNLSNIGKGAIENRGHRPLFVWQSDLRAQWRWINSELNLATAMKWNKKMGCRQESENREEGRKEIKGDERG